MQQMQRRRGAGGSRGVCGPSAGLEDEARQPSQLGQGRQSGGVAGGLHKGPHHEVRR
jgi:hypothetical protein